MLTATAEPKVSDFTQWAAPDPVDPIHNYNIPIPPFKHPPTREDLDRKPRRRQQQEPNTEQPVTHPTGGDGHIDDFA